MHVSNRAHAAFHYSARPLQPKSDRRAGDTDTVRVREVRRRPEDDRKGPSRDKDPDAEQQDETPDRSNDPVWLETAARQSKVATWSPAATAVKTAALWSLLGSVDAQTPDIMSGGPVATAPSTSPEASSLQDLLALAISKP